MQYREPTTRMSKGTAPRAAHLPEYLVKPAGIRFRLRRFAPELRAAKHAWVSPDGFC